MFRIFKWFAGAEVLLVVFPLVLGRYDWLLNAQIAFISSSLVLAASMFSYSQMVYSRLESGTAIPEDDRDTLDKIEDPHDLYGEEVSADNTAVLKDTIKEEKQRMKQHRRSLMQVLRDSKASLSFVRLGAYLLLFVGFLYLSKNQFLHIPSYLLGLTLPIVITLVVLMTKKEETDEAGL